MFRPELGFYSFIFFGGGGVFFLISTYPLSHPVLLQPPPLNLQLRLARKILSLL